MKKVLLCLFLLSPIFAKSQGVVTIWEANHTVLSANTVQSEISEKSLSYQLNTIAFNQQLESVNTQRERISQSNAIIYFPNEVGKLTAYKVALAPVLSSSMQAKYPSLKSYIGESLDNPNEKIRFSNSPFTGLNATIFNKKGTVAFIEKKGNTYHVVKTSDVEREPLQCSAKHFHHEMATHTSRRLSTRSGSSDGKLKVFRLALLLSSGFSNEILDKLDIDKSVGNSYKNKVIVSYLNSLLTKLNTVFERDIAVSLQLAENNESLFLLDSSKYEVSSDLDANQKIFDELIGAENYDIGHSLVLKNNEGVLGWSYVGAVGTSYKAGGFSTLSFNNGLHVLLHEIGHQLGATHTYNNISGQKSNTKTSVEVGRGKTIMSYGRIDALFYHTVSVLQMKECIERKVADITSVKTGNSKPIVDAGKDCIIPAQTPFLLEGKATDSEDKNLSYSWEQIDKEIALSPPSSTAASGPLFEWIPPVEEPIRFFPNLATILSGKQKNENEALPAVNRSVNFIFMARDNNPAGGEVGIDSLRVSVDENAGPFQITSWNKPKTLYIHEEAVLKWDVANTDKGGVNTPFVSILFSKDGGQTFPIEIASKVANSGSFKFQVAAGMETTQGRFMVKGYENVFLDINNAPITVRESDFLLNTNEKQKQLCLENTNTTTFEFIYNTYSDFSGVVSFQADNLENANLVFSPTSVTKDGTKVTLKVTKLSQKNIGHNILKIIAKSADEAHQQEVYLDVFHNNIKAVTLLSPEHEAKNVALGTIFEWESIKNVTNYLLEIAKDKTFEEIVAVQNITVNQCTLPDVEGDTSYYWRIKASNPCNEGVYSSIYHFTTGAPHSGSTYVPDDNFEKALIDLGYDTGTLDNYVRTESIDTIRELQIENYGIQDLTGIEDFRALETLSVTNAYASEKLTQVNLSSNTKLRVLRLSNNSLEELNVANLTALQFLICNQNNLTSIYIENNPQLKYLSCFGNQLDACNIDAIFIALPKREVAANIFLERYTLSNIGVQTCKTALLENKNWEAKKYVEASYTKLIGDGTGCSNHTPIADAGKPQKVSARSRVTLDASASIDVDGDRLSYEWKAPKEILLKDKTGQTPYFIAPEVKVATNYQFQLTVRDKESASKPASVVVTVAPSSEEKNATTRKEDAEKSKNNKIEFDGDIFEIMAESPACPNIEDGSVTITNNSPYDFNITIGNKRKNVEANDTQVFTGLLPGEYPMTCLLKSDTTQRITDYIVVVPEPKMFSVEKRAMQLITRSVEYVVEGATTYHLEVGNFTEIISFADEEAHIITVQLPGKESFVRISPASSCKGNSYEELVVLDEDIEIYPRVSRNLVYVEGLDSEQIEITLVNRKGYTVLQKTETPIAGRCAFDISSLSDNIYFVNVRGKNDLKTTYIYKQTL